MDSPFIYTGMVPDFVWALIPGELIAAAAKTLPDTQTDTEAFREATVDVPGGFKARIRFERFQVRRGMVSRWFWTPYSAALRVGQARHDDQTSRYARPDRAAKTGL